MCGITGLIDSGLPADKIQPILRRMTDSLIHRGPDDDGFYITDGIGLGMRRLSIIDLSGGKQPISNEDGTKRLIFNGEIYNYRTLRADLEKRGHAFTTLSDTETVIHSYEEYGIDCLTKLRGMFGFALWDSRHRELLLAVDHFGIKPIYYCVTSKGLIFGSELKALLASGEINIQINYDALAQYFTFGYIPHPSTIYLGIYKLPPGYFLKWGLNDKFILQQYWDFPLEPSGKVQPITATRQELRQVLLNSVRSQMVSDVPLGAFLSGGIDSSAIVALMSEGSSEPVKTFSIGFADREYNELDKARLIAQKFHTDHHELIVEPESIENLSNIMINFDEPFSDSSALPTYFVSSMARQFVKVVLSGDGGDETFFGYRHYQGLELARFLQLIPEPLRRTLPGIINMIPTTNNPGWNDRVSRWQKQSQDSIMTLAEAYQSKITMVGLPLIWNLLSKDLQDELGKTDVYQVVREVLARGCSRNSLHPLETFVYAGFKLGLAGDMLVKVDRMSMANSLEVRVPFLDQVLVEFTANIPVKQRFPHWRLKGLLRDTMADVLPAAILRQPKRGFAVPLPVWFRGNISAYVADVLLGGESRRSGYLNPAEVESALKQHQTGEKNIGSMIWCLLVFELWCKHNLKQTPGSA